MYSTEQGQNQTEQPAESFDLFVFVSWEVFQTSDRTRKIRGGEWFQRVGDIFWDTSLNLRGRGTCFTMVSSQSSLFECVDIYKFIHATSAEMNYSYHSIWTATCSQGIETFAMHFDVRHWTCPSMYYNALQTYYITIYSSELWGLTMMTKHFCLKSQLRLAPHGKTAEAVTSETNAANRITWLDCLRQVHEATRLQMATDGYSISRFYLWLKHALQSSPKPCTRHARTLPFAQQIDDVQALSCLVFPSAIHLLPSQ